jgi:hypothetical protein
MRFLCAFLGAAILMGTMHGCDSGDLKEGISKDSTTSAPPPNMDDMKAKMEKKKR